MERVLIYEILNDEEKYSGWLKANSQDFKFRAQFESLDLSSREFKVPKPSIEEPPELELKTLPSHLKYEFLCATSTLPVIISTFLSDEQEEKLLGVLKQHKRAIGWTIADIKDISPTLCIHKIIFGENSKNSIEGQRRLNLIMKEAVKEQIIKWLDFGIIYPILDSSWVSHVQCVPMKSEITVVKNEDNELILNRTVIGWRICTDYKKLNNATRNDLFPLSFVDQMLDRLAGRAFYCFLVTIKLM